MSDVKTEGPAISAAPPAAHPFSWLAYAQLVRLPNVFTAMADILMAGLAALVGAVQAAPRGGPEVTLPGLLAEHAGALGLILLASCCLYCSGMVWNDYFDLEQDQRERPFRPLPSGRISPGSAARLGTVLLVAGVGLATLAGALGEGFRVAPALLAALLAVNILLYDGLLKRTGAGPVAMGTCRFLNVMLGLSALPGAPGAGGVLLAVVVGVYIAGVTWFARTEAVASNQTQLSAPASVMLAALVLALAVPAVGRPLPRPEPSSLQTFAQVGFGQLLFPYLLVAFGFYVGRPVLRAIAQPTPERVQPAVKRAVLGLVLLDAILAASLAGTVGLLLALLLLPASALGRRIYST
jgi:4-hydroxybenzoate polyprenyltransferase